ncbi:hypothetical protein BIV25_01140 [Streptomyces sp. MUSC 14]|uniref:WbqC family protein n=1 Tax=Streptomyces sp. MUSC 14 TaxID=1354889 RepID=UPI0008F56A74|nr:WbqC family protein [Streptomyces sp. MUSC 14]OIK02841.1 hypothetical protein BIV25_01140 [Streptomyces sp. MUSC 14]
MILTAHQPAYLPWLGYFAKMAAADAFVLHDLSRFDRGGTVNRNKIRTANGPEWLTVPVSHADLRAERTLNVIEVVDDGWRRRHWKAIQMAYRRAPYFADHADFLADYYARSYATITELCVPFIEYCMKELGLERTLWRSSELDLGAFDRTSVIPALCEKFSADTFVAGVHARDYLEWDRITSVRLEIFEYDHPAYPQLHPGFQSHLSVLDLLMNCGPESRTLVKGTT